MKRYVFYRITLEVTSIPLAILWYLFIISGYGLIKTEIIKIATFGLLSYRDSIVLHTSPLLRILLWTLTVLHMISGFVLMSLRIRNKLIQKTIEVMIILIGFLLLLQFILIELS
ncbi:MAG TPA: hypothetical protein ENF93_01805 [Ignisphaera sp.]|nr:hypothetical protein [Ignisphaera sp.]